MKSIPEVLGRFYSRESLLRLFLICAFPLHVWTMLAAFRDFGWVAQRTFVWDAVSLVAYAMAFALFESLGLFLLLVMVGFLAPIQWPMQKRVALLGSLFLILAGWAIAAQLLSANAASFVAAIYPSMAASAHPLRLLWAAASILVALSVAPTAFLIARQEGVVRAVTGALDRLAPLSAFYVLLDLIAIAIIVIRNALLRFSI